jgi:hypothetical protein
MKTLFTRTHVQCRSQDEHWPNLLSFTGCVIENPALTNNDKNLIADEEYC